MLFTVFSFVLCVFLVLAGLILLFHQRDWWGVVFTLVGLLISLVSLYRITGVDSRFWILCVIAFLMASVCIVATIRTSRTQTEYRKCSSEEGGKGQ